MNRQTILAAIHRQLRENLAETGVVRPLGEVVGLVAEEIRSSRNGQVATGVIPIETVAAFVDGDLTAEESDAVCRAVMVDNSVLAELISAVRAIQQPAEDLQPLSDVLRNQLIAMQSSLPAAAAPTESIDDLPIAEEPAETTIRTQPARRLAAQKTKRSRSITPLAGILAVAATLALIIFLATRTNNNETLKPEMVQNQPPQPAAVPSIDSDDTNDSDVRIVDSNEQPKPAPRPDPGTPTIEPELDPSPVVVQKDAPVLTDRPPLIEPAVPDPSRAPVPDPPRPNPYNLAKATELSGLRWTKVTGVVTRRNDVSPTSQSRAVVWESVQSDLSAPVASTDQGVTLRTLPLSRAEATLQSGGRVVLAADSGVQVSQGDETTSAEIRLQYGDLALIDLPKGTLIRLIKAGHPLAVLRWQSQASAVLQHAADGLQVHVRHGTIEVNEQPQQNSSVAIARNRTIQSIQHPKRQPAWVDRPVETINVKQTFLAQIGESRNVMGTLNQQIRALSQSTRITEADARQVATLASWQAALAGENVFRLTASHTPVVRMAALNRIVTIPRWDPRYQRTWTVIENAARDKQRVARFKRLMFLAQQNGSPSAAQINTMLEDLAAPDIASRAMSDYLLRRFHAKASKRMPDYDPTLTGQAQLRAANQWRTYFGRTAAGAALQRQPNAAAADRLRQ